MKSFNTVLLDDEEEGLPATGLPEDEEVPSPEFGGFVYLLFLYLCLIFIAGNNIT